MIKDNQNTQEQLAEYLKIGILCYKYTHDEELFSIFVVIFTITHGVNGKRSLIF